MDLARPSPALRLWPRASALAAIALVVVALEIRGPSLPVPFELAGAARLPEVPAWLARLPMAAAALVALVTLAAFLRRTSGLRVAAYATLVLVTMPAWFVHGRTMTGAMIPIAASTLVSAASGFAALDRTASRAARLVAGAVVVATGAAASLVSFGASSRGLVLVVGVPLVSVGAAGLLFAHREAGAERDATRNGRRASIIAFVAGLLVLALSLAALLPPTSQLADVLLGAPATTPTPAAFSALVPLVMYGLVPWSPFLGIALARRPSSPVHLAMMTTAILGVLAQTALAPRSGTSALVASPAIAASIAFMLDSFASLRRPAVGLVVTVLVLGALVAHDMSLTPDRVLAAFGATDAAVPTGSVTASLLAVRSSIWLTILLAAFALAVPRSWLPVGRADAVAAAGVVAGLLLRAHAYPDLLARISPGAAFDTWARAHRPGEPLGIVGIDRRAVAFAPGTAVVPHSDPSAAARWLGATPASERRFVALGAPELPRLNAEWRSLHGANVPIIAGGATSTLLAASALASGESTTNPLDPFVLSTAPPMRRQAVAMLGDRLEVLGWEVTDASGKTRDAADRRGHSHLRVALRVLPGAASGNLGGHCTFLHVDHVPSRFSREHKTLPYPMTYWRPGDIVIDDFEIELAAHFRSGGRYAAYWGVGVLPCEDDRRMEIVSGSNDGNNRVALGALEVR